VGAHLPVLGLKLWFPARYSGYNLNTNYAPPKNRTMPIIYIDSVSYDQFSVENQSQSFCDINMRHCNVPK